MFRVVAWYEKGNCDMFSGFAFFLVMQSFEFWLQSKAGNQINKK